VPLSHAQKFVTQAAVGGLLLATWFTPGPASARAADITPAVGSTAPDVTLDSLRGGRVRLSEECGRGPVVLVVLRGYPGYQCPVCRAQVAELVGRAGRFRDAGARVILVYPGPAQGLKAHADEFVRGKALPENFDLLLDPDYELTQSYGLRWDAPNETAYPSTFVLDRDRKVRYAKVSHSHTGRAKADELLEVLAR
jgi:peroxiredoxin